jgi:hypothetical protein
MRATRGVISEMAPALPRIINRHRQRAEPGTPDQRDTLIIRVDRKPTDDEARALWASDALCKDRESSANTKVVFHWPTEQEVSLNTLGFFSPEIETFRAHVHSSPEAKIWLDFAEELTTFGLEMLSANDFPTDEGNRLTAAALFGRAHESMQASVTLAERGMIGDARAVARSAVENAIALHALAGGDNFTERLVYAKAHVDLQAARMLLEVAGVRAQLSDEQIAKVEGIRDTAEKLPKEKRRTINWADLAGKYDCGDLYQTLYRMLSNDGTHVSISAIVRRFEQDHVGEITMMKCGPDTDGLVSALNAATTAFLNSIEPFLKLYPNAEHSEKLKGLIERFTSMKAEELNWNT